MRKKRKEEFWINGAPAEIALELRTRNVPHVVQRRSPFPCLLCKQAFQSKDQLFGAYQGTVRHAAHQACVIEACPEPLSIIPELESIREFALPSIAPNRDVLMQILNELVNVRNLLDIRIPRQLELMSTAPRHSNGQSESFAPSVAELSQARDPISGGSGEAASGAVLGHEPVGDRIWQTPVGG